MRLTAFLEKDKDKDKHTLEQELDALELQLFRMQVSIKEIAKRSEIVSIDRTKFAHWVVIFVHRNDSLCRIMLHDCTKPWRGSWNAAIEMEYRGEHTIHIADIKGEENKGYGSVLMNYLQEMARRDNIQYITGDIVKRDFDHLERLQHFYSKHNFNVDVDYANECGRIVWNDR
ncbi:MAG TPA: hypothetical protein VK136_07340 [Bacillota bacterium]|nr:hypothetical protein [Bacillota bacterium]